MNLQDSVGIVKSVGKERQRLLSKIGVFNVEDLITYYPRDYEDRTKSVMIKDTVSGENCVIEGCIKKVLQTIKIGEKIINKIVVSDETDEMDIVFFNQSYVKNYFKMNDKFLFYGKIEKEFKKTQMTQPEYEKVENNENLSMFRIVPIYSLTAKLTQKMLRYMIRTALVSVKSQLKEFIPSFIREKFKLAEYKFSINNIHFPDNIENFFAARRRLIFEELLIAQLGLMNIKNKIKVSGKRNTYYNESQIEELESMLPFELTSAQNKVLNEIINDMKSDKCMNRLVQGDVGSGKTVVAMLAMFFAVKNGYQTVLMVPTEVLAEQHYDSINVFFEKFGITTELLTGSLTKKKKGQIYEEIEKGDIQVVIGTHAIIQDKVRFKNLSLVITDEQHRFGVEQRQLPAIKGENPDVLVMTATPIPRTLALILYGDLDISTIDVMPVGRKPVNTYVVNSSYYARLYEFIKKEINNGRQVYFICPMVEEVEREDMKSLKNVIQYAKDLNEKHFSKYKVGYVHGKMKSKEKKEVMESFKNNEIDILVATTVIEVGISVENATIMVIENADRFGLNQLHQIRGRVGRGDKQSYCILISDTKNAITRKRLEVIKDTSNGFKISDEDLKLRGPGDFFGTRQHGLPEFKIANLYEDMPILKEAQKAANMIINEDEFLEKLENKELKGKIEKMFAVL